MYATPDDLGGSLPSDWADQFTDDGDGANTSKLDTACKDASDWVDGFLARFVPPMAIGLNATQRTLDCLRVHAVVRAKHEIMGRKVGPEGYRSIDQDFAATERFLTGVMKGAPLPGAFEPVVNTPPASVTGSVTPGEIVWDEDSAVL